MKVLCMAAGIANPLRMCIFSFMNGDKAYDSLRTDNKERGLVSILQMRNSASGAMELAHGHTGKVANCLNDISESIKAARSTSKAFDCACKGINIVSEMVNPILVVASGVRVYNSDDKKSAMLKEAGAMTGMFAAESAYKTLFGLNKGSEATYKKYKLLNNTADGIKKFCSSNKFLSKIPSGKIGGIIKGLGFIAASCSAFAIGSEIGDAIAQRTTAKDYAAKHALTKVSSDESNQETASVEKHALEKTPSEENSTKEYIS
ncbi:MAG: hypothetical protein LUB59_06320 [Candidatus Gastranaerophilales bacterium]|nr:hypothetical protein [Candidatus Gastranaerophilales bacterium]